MDTAHGCAPRCCTTPSRTPRYTLAQITEDFGSEIASLVDGVTKLDKVTSATQPSPPPSAR